LVRPINFCFGVFYFNRTLPLIHYREHLATKTDSDNLMETLQHPNGQISDLIEKIRAAGSLTYAENVTIDHVKQALSQLEHLPRGDARDYLASLAEILLSRNA
jgi:geranylgeranyl pyrophosphate synthase